MSGIYDQLQDVQLRSITIPKFTAENIYERWLKYNDSKNMAVAGTKDAPKLFVHDPVRTGNFVLVSVISLILEDGGTNFSSQNFGAIADGLSNGVEVAVKKNSRRKIELFNWKQNRDILAVIRSNNNSWGAGDYSAFISMADLFNGNFLVLEPNDQLIVSIQDDISALDYMAMKLRGAIVEIPPR